MGYGNFGLFYLCSFFGVLALEAIAGRHRGVHSRSDWIVTILSTVLGMGVIRPLLAIGSAALFLAVAPGQAGAFADVPAWLAFPVILLVAEFLFYWAHRLAHAAKGKHGFDWLWKLHRTHHSAKYINVLVIFRLNPFWAIIQPQTWVIGYALYAGQPFAAALAGVTEFAWNIVTHSHFRWDDKLRAHPVTGRAFRMLERIFVSPGIHHTHHGYGRDGANYRNFGLIFSCFDGLFGTLLIPEGRPWRYGVPGPNAHWSEEVFFPIVRRSN